MTVLQRTPSYIMAVPNEDAVANLMRRVLGGSGAMPRPGERNIAQ
jgi:monooxygenase